MKTAMILAAGRGERLKPLTETRPKALCIIRGKPLIEHHIINLARAGFERLVINHAYLGGQIRQYVGNGNRWGIEICYSPEPPGGLETGGGILNALPLIGKDPFLTVNADIFTDFDFAKIKAIEFDLPHLVLVKNNQALHHHGDFGLNKDGRPINTDKAYTFAGIACYNPQIFDQCQQGRYSVTPLIRHWVQQNKTSAQIYQGLWFDIGSLERLHAANHTADIQHRRLF